MVTERVFPKDTLARVVLALSLLYMAVLIWIPILDTFFLSLHEAFFFKREWIGVGNYVEMFTDDPLFWKSLRVTFTYALMTVPPTVVLGLLLAVLVNSTANITLRSILMGFYFFAYIVPLVAVAIFWLFLLQPSEIGLVNAALAVLGLPTYRWLDSTDTSLLSLAIVSTWRHIGYMMVLFVAGIQSIPELFHEAAAIDGANALQRLWHITLPLLMPTIAFVTVIGTLGALMMFAEVFVMTGTGGYGVPKGGPNYSTHTVVYNIFFEGFSKHREGYASAIASVFFVIVVAIGYVQFRFLRAQYEY